MPVAKLHHFFADLPVPMGFNTSGETVKEICNRKASSKHMRRKIKASVDKMTQQLRTTLVHNVPQVFFGDVAEQVRC